MSCDLGIGVLGANGFIGSRVLQALIRSGKTPLAIHGPGAIPRSIPERIKSVTCDLTAAEDLARMISGLDVIIHAAGPPSVRRSFEIPEHYQRVHVEGTAALLRACHKSRVHQVIYISSAEVYGRPDVNPVREDHRLHARSPYAAAKIAAEKTIEVYAELYDLNVVVLRPFSVYGPNPNPESLFGTIMRMAKDDAIHLHDLRPIRDYCHVDDLADAVLRASCWNAGGVETFNIGTGVGTSVADFADLVVRSIGVDLPIVQSNSPSRSGSTEIFELIADISKARTLLGWNPEIALKEGVRRVVSGSGEGHD